MPIRPEQTNITLDFHSYRRFKIVQISSLVSNGLKKLRVKLIENAT
jgi:hypothetical protein